MKTLLQRRFLSALTATPQSRAWLLSFLQSTEEADEGYVFETLRERVSDPKLAKMIRRHEADETEHAKVFAAAIARIGVAIPDVPESLHVVADLDLALGGLSRRFLDGEAGVMEMYLMLLVLEERAVRDWPAIAEAMRKHDPAAAADIDRVIADETRHVAYASAIARRYAPNEETFARELERYRAIEAWVFEVHTAKMTEAVVERGLLAASKVEQWFWRTLGRAQARKAESSVGALADVTRSASASRPSSRIFAA